MTEHTTGTREEWTRARRELLDLEKEHTQRSDELARLRRELPWVRIDKPYVFERTTKGAGRSPSSSTDGDSSSSTTSCSTPDWNEGCVGCSLVADHFDGGMVHLSQRDVTMVCVSRAPWTKIGTYKRRMGWRLPWFSSLGSDFNYDFHVSFTPEQQAGGAEYNFRREEDPGDEGHGLSSFALEDGVLYHVYSTYGRGTDVFNTFYQLLDRAPKGRDEDNLPPGRVVVAPPRRVRERDEHDRAHDRGERCRALHRALRRPGRPADPPRSWASARRCSGGTRASAGCSPTAGGS